MTKRTVVDDDHSTAQTKEEHQSSPVKRWRRRKSSILATENNINDKKQVADDNEEMQEMEDEDFPQRAPRVRRMGPKPKINKNAESNVTTKSKKKKRASSGNDDVDSKSSKKKRRKISHTSTPKTTPASTSDFSFITKNIYIGKKPVLEDEDEHVCNCQFPQRCGDDCVNRLLNIECRAGMCPMRHRCTNQQFQKNQWAKVEIREVGMKGRGLFTTQSLKKGQFVIEYVGEVCNEETYQNRMMEYDGERHYYFLSLDSGYVIDASRRGNSARFINHSCNPNCTLQKWLVGKETRIGIFTLCDVPADTELTFDYAMEVYGLAHQKCYCGERNCRGTIRSKDKIQPKALTEKQLMKLEATKHRNKIRKVTQNTLKMMDDFDVTSTITTAGLDHRIFLIRNLLAGRHQRILDYIKAERFYESSDSESEEALDNEHEFVLTDRERRRQAERYAALQKASTNRPLRATTKSKVAKSKAKAAKIQEKPKKRGRPKKSESPPTKPPPTKRQRRRVIRSPVDTTKLSPSSPTDTKTSTKPVGTLRKPRPVPTKEVSVRKRTKTETSPPEKPTPRRRRIITERTRKLAGQSSLPDETDDPLPTPRNNAPVFRRTNFVARKSTPNPHTFDAQLILELERKKEEAIARALAKSYTKSVKYSSEFS